MGWIYFSSYILGWVWDGYQSYYIWVWVGVGWIFLLLAGLRERFLPVVFVRSFQVRNMDSSLGLVYENDSQVGSMKKILWRINVTHIKKKFKLKTLLKKKKLHARLFFKYYSLHPKI
jgi:hypothetical protein